MHTKGIKTKPIVLFFEYFDKTTPRQITIRQIQNVLQFWNQLLYKLIVKKLISQNVRKILIIITSLVQIKKKIQQCHSGNSQSTPQLNEIK